MGKLKLSSVIERAIQNERDACKFYAGLHKKVEDPVAKDALKLIAGEERKHLELLMDYREGRKSLPPMKSDEDIENKVGEYVVAPDIKKDMNSSEIYLVAAHRELNAFLFYKGLASLQPEGEAKEILLQMAGEELKHKEKVEYLYGSTAFPSTAVG